MNTLKLRRLWVLIGYGLVTLVVALSLSPSLPQQLEFPLADKFYHLLAYGVLMLWFAQLLPRTRYGWLVCGFIALGVVLEMAQSQIGTRGVERYGISLPIVSERF